MRSLNECFGGGTSIPINYQAESSLLDDIQELTKDELKRVQEEKAEKAAIKCAQAVSQRCNGKPCMKTSIHSRLPFFQDHLNFFFDDEYMMKCCVNASSANIEKCAGSAYFKFVQQFFYSHYYLYDNGCEGIRDGCTENGDPMCKFHKNIEYTERLVNGWRSKHLKRVPPPVPDYSRVDGFHYCKLEQIYNGDVTEKFGIKKDMVCDPRRRERDDFCPRKQLDKLLSSCGEADIVVEENAHDDESVSLNCVDKNNTLQKAMAKMDEFVERISGDDLRNSVESEIKRRHDMKVKAFITKSTNASNKAIEKAKTINDIDWAKCIKEDSLDKLYVSQLNLYLVDKIGMSKSECDKKGYTKLNKIEDIKANYYATTYNRVSGTNTSQKSLSGMYSLQPNTGVHVPPSRQPIHVPPSSQPVHVPPWGGCLYNQSIMQTQTLINTCPIDNYLTLFYLLMNDYKNFFNELLASPEIFAATLVQVKSLFDKKHFEHGKILWLHQFQGRFNLNAPIIDTWGNEDDLFFSQLQPVLCSKYSGKCSSAACPAPYKEYVSYNISLRYKV